MLRTRIGKVVQHGGLGKIALVGLARNGVEVLRIAQATHPDVVTMDLTMPEMDGVECIRKMLRLLPATNILVIPVPTTRQGSADLHPTVRHPPPTPSPCAGTTNRRWCWCWCW